MDSTSISNLLNLPAGTATTMSSSSSTASSGGVLGRDEFLELLTLQLRFQDPLNPVSNQEFAAQLAQFSSLEQMQQMNESMETQLLLAQSSHNALATSMIGREVRVFGEEFSISGDGTLPALLVEPQEPGRASVEIRDADAQLVRTLTVDFADTEITPIEWDGKGDDGEELPAGRYSFRVTMTGGDEDSLRLSTYIEDTVDRIRFTNGVTELLLGTAPYTLADVLEIRA